MIDMTLRRTLVTIGFLYLSLIEVEWDMYTNLLIVSVLALVAGVFLALDTIVLVSGISGIMFCLSIIVESFGSGDLI